MALHLCRAVEDVYYEVKKCGASAIVKLCRTLRCGKLEPQGRDMVKSVIGAMSHQHFRVRLACLEALDALVLHGVSDALIEEMIAPGVANIVVDPSSTVRKTCFGFLAEWVQATMRSDARAI